MYFHNVFLIFMGWIESFSLRYIGEHLGRKDSFSGEAVTGHGKTLVCPVGRATGEESEKWVIGKNR